MTRSFPELSDAASYQMLLRMCFLDEDIFVCEREKATNDIFYRQNINFF